MKSEETRKKKSVPVHRQRQLVYTLQNDCAVSLLGRVCLGCREWFSGS